MANILHNLFVEAVESLTKIITPIIQPKTDGTTAIKVQNVAGSTNIVTVDTTNNKVTFGKDVVVVEKVMLNTAGTAYIQYNVGTGSIDFIIP